MLDDAPASDAPALPSEAPDLPSKSPRNRSIDARRAARAAKARREQRIMAFLVKGVSVAELAGREGLSERRRRAIVQDILSRRMPEPPAEFLALQVARLNEAMIVAHGAMGNGNLGAVDRVIRITRELDRYHGFAEAIEARASRRSTLQPAPAALGLGAASMAEGRRLAAPGARDARPLIRLQMAPQAVENLAFAPGNSAPPEAAGSPEQPAAEASPVALTCPAATAEVPAGSATGPHPTPPAPALEARPAIRLQTAPQAIENLQFTPGNDAPPQAAGSQEEKAAEAATDRAASTADPEPWAEAATDPEPRAEAAPAPPANPEPAPAPAALEAPPASGRLEMAPQAIENPQFAPENEAPPEAANSPQEPATEVSPADLADPAATSQAAPGTETDPESMDEAAPAGPLDPDPAQAVPVVAPLGMVVANVVLPPYATPQPGPTAFAGFIRCAGQVTYYL
jgi:hypothetical protein